MQTRRHSWIHQGSFPGRRCGSMHVVLLCRYCNLLTTANAGSAPLRPGPCEAPRPAPPPIVWAARRYGPHARLFWLLR